jgi:mannose-6-phosphate isomerase-like protein (cupin superfamily)
VAQQETKLTTAQDILTTYLHVQDDGRTSTIPVSDSFWQELSQGAHPQLEQGRLMTAFTFSEPWSSWERHPAGEELVLLVSGAVTLVLEEQGSHREVFLGKPGEFVLVPPNVWHTARPAMPTTMLFLTPGAGTDHRPA